MDKDEAVLIPGVELVSLDPLTELESLHSRVAELELLLSTNPKSYPPPELVPDLEEESVADLKKKVSLLRATLNSTTDGILVLNREERADVYNSSFLELWQIPVEMLDQDQACWLEALAAPLLEDSASFIHRIRHQLRHSNDTSRDILRFVDGRIFEGLSHPQLINGKNEGRVWLFRDVTEQRRAQEQVEYQATYDQLTDLPNRRLLLDRLNQMLARCRRHNRIGALLFLDLDNFKTINDTLGHPIGDALLKQVAGRLMGSLRREDTAARLGGDEFVLLLSESDDSIDEVTERVDTAAKKILNALSQQYEVKGRKLYASTSIGVSLFPQGDETADDVLKQADTAMYRAKDAGRNTVRFYLPSMHKLSEDKLHMQNDLRQALENNQFKVYWQPQVDIHGATIGAEALLRWEHPVRGLVMPNEFISIAEEIGIITTLGDFVIEEACSLLANLSQNMPEVGSLHLSINVSPQQFDQADFSNRIAKVLDETGANPPQLTLELTESMLAANLDQVMKRMVDLKRLGVRLSIDDFGTGYSSLAYLKRLPLDDIKIDRSFVCDIVKDPETVSIVEAILTMATKLGLCVVAEGVESQREYDFLRKRGCHYFQGYMFGEPISEPHLLEFLQDQTQRIGAGDGLQSTFEGF